MGLHNIYYNYDNYNINYDNHTIQDVRSSWVEMVFMEGWQQVLKEKRIPGGIIFLKFNPNSIQSSNK